MSLSFFEPTEDPYVLIKKVAEDKVIYKDTQSGEQWVIEGQCNLCGLCELGANNKYIVWNPGTKPGQPDACYDLRRFFNFRKDVPIRPELINEAKNEYGSCVLTGYYINDKGEKIESEYSNN